MISPVVQLDELISDSSRRTFLGACEATGFFLDLAERYAGPSRRSTCLVGLMRAATKYGRAVELARSEDEYRALERMEKRLRRVSKDLLPGSRFWDPKWCLPSWRNERGG